MNKEMVGPVARRLVIAACGALTQRGLMTEDDLTTLTGIVVGLVTLAYSIWSRRKLMAPAASNEVSK
jgi:hypothetical protein